MFDEFLKWNNIYIINDMYVYKSYQIPLNTLNVQISVSYDDITG